MINVIKCSGGQWPEAIFSCAKPAHTSGLTLLMIPDNSWQFLTIPDNCWQFLTILYNCWQLLTIADNCLQLLIIADNCWQSTQEDDPNPSPGVEQAAKKEYFFRRRWQHCATLQYCNIATLQHSTLCWWWSLGDEKEQDDDDDNHLGSMDL